MKKIILATRNKDKFKEIKKMFEYMKCNVEIINMSTFANIPEVEEDGETLKANAIKKAKVIGNHTGLPSLSDDTGLFVDYLDGAPGVHCSRYADRTEKHTATYEDNYKKLLKELENVPWEKRTAKFVCISALYLPKENKCITRKGEVKGYISLNPVGKNGFGYDPVFYLPSSKKTFAELKPEEKNLLSHRFLAIKQMIQIIKSL